MYKIYFKQAIQMLKQNKFISIVTIAGTALAIMMIMVIIVTESVKNVSIAPESNRGRTLYIKNFVKKKQDGWMNCSDVLYDLYKNYLSELKTPEVISAINVRNNFFTIKLDNSEKWIYADVKCVDAAYWKIMAFSFLEGKPFTQDDFNSGIPNAVITETIAKQVFGNDDALGKEIEVDFKKYKVTGVIEKVSQAFPYAYGEIYIPYTSKGDYKNQGYNVLLLLRDKKDFSAVDEEVKVAERKDKAVDPEWDLTFMGPYDHKTQLIHRWTTEEPNKKAENKKMILIFTILMLIPALNLSNFSLSRMKQRTEEIGIRKAFGAKKYVILIQVLYENFITSLIGGIIGLILSYVAVVWLKEWLLGVGQNSFIPVSALISLPVFIAVFVVCFLLNLLSAGIPAYNASRTKIVDSLNKK